MNIKHLDQWRRRTRTLFLGGAVLAGTLVLSACSGGSDAPAAVAQHAAYVSANANAKGAKLLQGKARGGNQPIAWSIITLYAAGNSGYGSANPVGYGYSDQNGDVTAIYYCPAGNPQIYAVASGGDAGGGYNTAIGLSAPLGQCQSLPAQVTLDEVTTAASAYALAQFLDATGQQPGTSAANAVGLGNAVSVFGNLADLASGAAQTALPAGASGTLPSATLNTLADILAPCVMSSGPASSQCAALFGGATPAGGTAPTSTLQAALDIARNPGNNVAALFALAGASGPFQPALPAAPNDWTLGISYSGGNLLDLRGLAVDAGGNVWTANLLSASGVNSGNGAVVQLNPQGVQSAPFLDNGAVHSPSGIAVDGSGNVWVTNLRSASTVNGGQGSISGLSGTGASLGGSPFTVTGLSRAGLIAADASGNVWLGGGRNVAELNHAAGYTGSLYPVTDSTHATPSLTGLALDNSGNIWLADAANNVLVQLSAANPTQQVAGSPYSGGGLIQPVGFALDASVNAWAANNATLGASNGVSELLNSANGYSVVQHLGNGVYTPAAQGGVAIDGAGKVWIANQGSNGVDAVVALGSGGAPLNGSPFTAGGALSARPSSVAIDPSGNVWVGGGVGNNVVEVVGAAVPVKAPLVGLPQLP